MNDSMKDLLQQAMQARGDIKKMDKELSRTSVTGEAGAGMVKVTMTCKYKVKAVEIDPALCDGEQLRVLQDLMVAACNDAAGKVEKATHEKMAGLMGGMGGAFPGMPL